jgi:hypothetical protein
LQSLTLCDLLPYLLAIEVDEYMPGEFFEMPICQLTVNQNFTLLFLSKQAKYITKKRCQNGNIDYWRLWIYGLTKKGTPSREMEPPF